MSLLESYNNLYQTKLFLNEFTIEELENVTVDDIYEGVQYFLAVCDKKQARRILESIDNSVYILSESNTLTYVEEAVMQTISEGIKNFIKGTGKFLAKGAGYTVGLANRIGRGLSYYYGSGYARGRGTNYGDYGGPSSDGGDDGDGGGRTITITPSRSSTSRGGTATSSSQPGQSRGFSGTAGIRSGIGQAYRSGVADQYSSMSRPTQDRNERIARENQRRQERMARQRQRISTSMTPYRRVTVGGQQSSGQRLAQQGQRISAAMSPYLTGAARGQQRSSNNRTTARVTTSGTPYTPGVSTRTTRIGGPPISAPSIPRRSPPVTGGSTTTRTTGPIPGRSVSSAFTQNVTPSPTSAAPTPSATTRRTRRAPSRGTASTATTTSLEEYIDISLNFIEYLIECGYVNDLNSGLNVLENFSEEAIYDLTEQYLFE